MIKNERKKRIRKESDREADKRYNAKRINFSASFTTADIEEGKRLKEYLELIGQSGNSYLKELIKKDLDEKGV